jgi:general stress protein 26
VSANSENSQELKKITDIISGIHFAMLTTAEPDGSLHSRPMTTQQVEFDGDLWFFTKADSPKVWEAEQHRQVNVSFADPGKGKYVSASGTAVLSRDRAKMEELWKAPYQIFFPQGLEDPEIALLKISVNRAEYWDSASNAVARAIDFAKAFLKKDPSELGEHAKLTVK